MSPQTRREPIMAEDTISDAQCPEPGARRGPPWRRWALPVVALVVLFSLWFVLPVEGWLADLHTWVDGLGTLGWLVFGLVYVLATVALVPGSLLTLAAGVAFGLWAFPLVVVAATVGASLAFLAGRYLARDKVRRAIAGRPKFQAVDRAVKKDGWQIVGLLRLSPIVPFNLQNWFFGTTSVDFWHYLVATFFGIMPGTLLYVWIGSLGGMAGGGNSSASTLKHLFFGVGLVATAVVTWLVTRRAKATLKAHGLNDGATPCDAPTRGA